MNISSLQERQKHQKQNGKWNNNVGEPSNRRMEARYFVQLAPESPLRKSSDILYDDSSYDSFHNYETDICKDSSDDDYSDGDSSQTEGFAVMDVIEYEIPDDSESDEVSSASSGTDDFTLEAATAACYEFNALMNRHSSRHMSEDDDSDFILADTGEDSDGSIDLELGQADYWKCVKCNNLQNNPRFRYCERCFQLRKSLFPPRPRRQKSRAEHNRKRKMAHQSQEYSSSEVESDPDVPQPSSKKLALSPRADCLTANQLNAVGSKNGNLLNIKDKIHSESNKHTNSAGEFSCNNNTSSDDGDDGETVLSDADRIHDEVVRKVKVSPSSSIEIAKVHVADCSEYPTSATLVKLTPTSHLEDHYLDFKIENKIIQNVYRQDALLHKRPNLLEWKDSGLSSCQDSSQEFNLSPMEDGFLIRSTSSGSTRSFDSQSDFPASQASTQIQQDSDDTDSEGILKRVEQFTQEREGKMKQEHSQSSISCRPSSSNDLQPDDINDSNLGLCRFCMVNPKNGVFVHNNCLHLCCCYKCAIKVWKKRKSCPICNCKIKNVTKLFVH